MAELRVKSTGTLKLFESDNTSSVTIASPASLGADRTVTLPDASVTLASGTMLATDGSGASLTALNASELGSGTVPTARLGSGTASSSTVLYGDQTYKAEPGGGKIGQVVHTKNTTYQHITTSSFVECISVTITPSATSSKILVLNSAHIGKHTNDTQVIERMYRVVGAVDTSTQVLSDISGDNKTTTHNDIGFSATQFYDSPSSTAAITYSYRICSYSNNSGVLYNDYNAGGAYSSQMTAMEILA